VSLKWEIGGGSSEVREGEQPEADGSQAKECQISAPKVRSNAAQGKESAARTTPPWEICSGATQEP
jgi:hypothetical protein